MAFDLRGASPLYQVYDMPASMRFYCDLLGFQVVNTSPVLATGYSHWVMLRMGAAELMLNTAFESDEDRPPVPDSARNAAHGDTTLYLACPDVDAAFEELRGQGIDVKEPTVTFYGMKQLYLLDPDGYGICFQWPANT